MNTRRAFKHFGPGEGVSKQKIEGLHAKRGISVFFGRFSFCAGLG